MSQYTCKSDLAIQVTLELIWDKWNEIFPSIPFNKSFVDFEELFYTEQVLSLEEIAKALKYPRELSWIKRKKDREEFLSWVLQEYGQKAFDFLNYYLEDFRR
jgi:hypothetical protein